MSTSQKIAGEPVSLDCGKWLVRSVTADDASERWAGWLTDPNASHFLNAPPKAMKLSDLVSYIKSFDQKSRLLLGIVEKASDKLIGFLRADIDHPQKRFLISVLIGEPDFRNKGVMFDITGPLQVYFFETLGMQTILATALARNRAIIHYLLATGWKRDKAHTSQVKSHADGAMLDLYYFSMTRDTVRAWRKADVPGRNRLRQRGASDPSSRSDS
jgi:RimJ/RimL family protein N-acetyltransferase